jgi:glycosyltransferase involved in cell wall biosynthesis
MISVITPSFRQLDWLRLAMASVADQEGVEVEHIVQDAGTEGVKEMFEDSTNSFDRQSRTAELFIEKDAGMYDAINRGLEKAHGDICAYLNCDEQYLPETLRKVASCFADHPNVDVLFGDAVLIDSKGRPLSYRRAILPTRRHLRLSHLNTSTCATFFRHKLFANGFRFDPQWKAIGDAVWVDELLRNKVPMAILPQPLAVFTFTGRNLGATGTSRSETLRWRGPGHSMVQSAVAVFWHRIRKAAAGAYQRRNIRIDIYTPDSPSKRRRITAERVGFGWPKN